MIVKPAITGLLLALACLVLGHASAEAAAVERDPAALFQQVKQATGGAAWDAVVEIRAVGSVAIGGLRGSMRGFTDTKTGRSAVYSDLGPEGGGSGFDGIAGWQQDASRSVRTIDAPDSRAGTLSDAYIARNGWFDPRDPADQHYLGRRKVGGRGFNVVRVVPAGGRPIEVWIDATTHRIGRLVTRLPTAMQTIRLSNYRRVGDLVLPFRTEIDRGGAQDREVVTVSGYELAPMATNADFRRPADNVADGRILIGDHVVVPIAIEAGHVVIGVTIGGVGPLPFIFDTGGRNLATPETARRLNLKGEGAAVVGGVGEGDAVGEWTHVGRLRIGAAELENQQFLTVALPPLIVDRGGAPPIAGLVGYELLKHFAIELDYAGRRLTLWPIAGYKYGGTGTELPFGFADTIPQVSARVDGVDGQFVIDTGDPGAVTLFGPFVDAQGFKARYRHGLALAAAGGIGGAVPTFTTRVTSFDLAGFRVDRPITEFVDQHRGAFASTTLAGSIGYDILSRFRITFDYGHQRLYFEPGADFGRVSDYNRAGLSVTKTPAGFTVLGVARPSPAAAAGILAGDAILSIDDRPVGGLSFADLRQAVERPPGTRLLLALGRRGGVRSVRLTLAEVLP
ncbi:MAG TPA: aspartyl protease family protein [Stellaceae bacterium]|nr:aspartyl protease family protein [Stellaceae bacterium]